MIWLHPNYSVYSPALVTQNKTHFEGHSSSFFSHSMDFLPRLPIFHLFFSKWLKLLSVLSLCLNMLYWLFMLSFWTLNEMHYIGKISNGGFPSVGNWHVFIQCYWCLENIVCLTKISKASHKTDYNSVRRNPPLTTQLWILVGFVEFRLFPFTSTKL